MKTIISFLVMFLFASGLSQSQDISSYGRHFLFAIPPNDTDNNETDLNVLKLYITAVENSEVLVTYNGKTNTYNINANSTKEIDLMNQMQHSNFKFAQEIYETGTVKNKSFEVTSNRDISISVLNSKVKTADSFVVFPTKAWGNNYIHLAFWDLQHDVGLPQNKHSGSGILIIANEDNTLLTVKYKGKTGTKTVNGKNVGEIENITLNHGEIYSIRSTGIGELKYDLSGTQVLSNKPVGAISFHQRTSIPGQASVNGKDHLVEMITPVTAWGKKYVCLQLNREDKESWFQKKWGDYFRGIASEDGTIVSCKSYDLESGELLDNLKFEIDANQFFEYNGSKLSTTSNRSIRGISIWESNKPFMLMQYCYSADWDGKSNYDPFMTLAVPTEQYVEYTVFNVPGESSGILYSYANILVNASDTEKEILKTMKLDGISLADQFPQLLLNKVPNEDLFWLRLPISQGNHIIESDAKFGAYLYGFGEHISYGHTTSQGFKVINNDGVPKIELTEVGCGEYRISVSDSSGIQNLEFEDVSNITIDTTDFYKAVNSFHYSFNIYVQDIDLDCKATIFATDVLGFTGKLVFTFPEEETKYYQIKLTPTKPIFETTDKIKADIELTTEYWDIYPLDNFELEVEFDPAKYRFEYFESTLGDDYIISERLDTSDAINKCIIKFEALTDTTVINTDSVLGAIVFNYRWNNDINPSFTADMYASPYSTRCIKSKQDTVTTPVRMCAPEIFAIEMGENYNLSKIAPNPISNQIEFSITVPFDTQGQISIIDLNGKIIKDILSGTVNNGKSDFKVDTKEIPAGVYILKVQAGLMNTQQKIIKVD